jgi:hypothetical protein
MPYIKSEKRKLIVENGGRVDGTVVHSDFIDCAGDLNYAFTILAVDYLQRKGLNYQSINDVVGAFVNAKDEFNRRVTAEYEDNKIEENGDVYPNLRTPIYPSAEEFNEV